MDRFIETEQGRIWYCVYGEDKSGIPILVVHGGPGFMSMPQVVCELAADRPVYFYDQLGSGKSDKAADANLYSLEYFMDELEDVRRQLRLSEFLLMGFSWGCGLAVSYLLDKKPAGVKGLVLSGPLLSTPMWDRDQRGHIRMMPQTVIDAIEKGEESGDFGEEYQEAMMAFYRKFVCRLDPWPGYLMDAFGMLNMDVYLSMWGPSEFTITGKLKDFDLVPRLGDVEVPVLLTCGDNDEAGIGTVKEFQSTFRDARMAVIPDSSHLHQIEQPLIYLAVVQSFLKDK